MALNKRNLVWLMILVLLAAPPAARAALTHLPSTGEEGSIYSGISSALGPVIEFAVFDSEDENYAGVNGMDLEEQGRFVYVYEIFNTYFGEITYFNIYGIGEGAVDSDEDISTLDDGDGVDAESYYFNSDYTKATWVFNEGELVYGEDSVFLIVYSNNSWVPGSYDFQIDDEFPVQDDVPEPASLMLLSIGAFFTCRKSVKK